MDEIKEIILDELTIAGITNDEFCNRLIKRISHSQTILITALTQAQSEMNYLKDIYKIDLPSVYETSSVVDFALKLAGR